jgi:hypothetical protein
LFRIVKILTDEVNGFILLMANNGRMPILDCLSDAPARDLLGGAATIRF